MEDSRKNSDILNKVERLPGRLAIIPLVLAVIIAAFFPQAFQIGGYVTALFYDGNLAMMKLLLTVCGPTINTRQVGMPLYRGVALIGIKLLLGVIMDLLVGELCRPANILGLTPFILTTAITNSDGSLYISLSFQLGSATDTEAIPILSPSDDPLFALVILGATGLTFIPFRALVTTLIPLLIESIWGDMDRGFRSACTIAQPIATFFMTISIDSKTGVSTLVTASASGTVLGLILTATAVVFFFVFNLLLPEKERSAIGAVVSTTTLNSAMTPAAITRADPSMGPHVDITTAQCVTVSITILFLYPFITAFFDGRMRRNKRGIYSLEGWTVGKA